MRKALVSFIRDQILEHNTKETLKSFRSGYTPYHRWVKKDEDDTVLFFYVPDGANTKKAILTGTMV